MVKSAVRRGGGSKTSDPRAGRRLPGARSGISDSSAPVRRDACYGLLTPTRTWPATARLHWVATLAFFAIACGSGGSSSNKDGAAGGGHSGALGSGGSGNLPGTLDAAGSGGESGTGGIAVGSGGVATGSGGALASAGAAGSGGRIGTGAVTVGSGGVTGPGGVPGTGGLVAAGGGLGTGGLVAAGGVPATGGVVASGGALGTGGVVASGGAPGAGGVVASGGAPGTGGAGGTAGTGGEYGFTYRSPGSKSVTCIGEVGPQTEDFADEDFLCTFHHGSQVDYVYTRASATGECLQGLYVPVYRLDGAEISVNGVVAALAQARYEYGGNHHNDAVFFDFEGHTYRYFHSSFGTGARSCQPMDCIDIYVLDTTTLETRGCGPDRSHPEICVPIKAGGTHAPLVDTFAKCPGDSSH